MIRFFKFIIFLLKIFSNKYRNDFIEENKAIDSLINYQDINPLLMLIKENKLQFPRQVGYNEVYSKTGRISFCSDIYGYEVSIDDKGFIDCHYNRYGITREEAETLMNLIASCVPK